MFMTPSCDTDTGRADGSTASCARASRPLRVLLVDDHLLVRCKTRRQLDDIPNLQVVGEATDGFEAVALAKTLSPDLVFMDICMPGLDGIEATRRIRAEAPRARVIMLSSHDGASHRKAALAAGAAGYLTKGQTAESLAAAIEEVFPGS
jgi:DNA-binding NarL/FixJ family response regulator